MKELILKFGKDTIPSKWLDRGFALPTGRELDDMVSNGEEFNHDLVWVSDEVPPEDIDDDPNVKLGYLYRISNCSFHIANVSHKHHVILKRPKVDTDVDSICSEYICLCNDNVDVRVVAGCKVCTKCSKLVTDE